MGDATPNYTWERIKEVQPLVEKCLQHYLSAAEIVATLRSAAQIEPKLTCTVLRILNEENVDFFKGYNLMLQIKDQIVTFNYLVQQQNKLQNPNL